MNKCAFTICSKNYLAQAFTLRESFLKYNSEIDFHIFLADIYDHELLEKFRYIIPVNEKIVPKLEDMAFKYNVIEFNTSIKPFCIKYLLDKYEKVMYLDPDIYVTSSLSVVFDMLNEKDFVITPHYNHLEQEFTGAIPEEIVMFVGVFNLGFCAVKKGVVGEQIIHWWMNRLENKCFDEKSDALFVDQKWIDYLPAAFPNDVCICHHSGMNVATWNLHERTLITENEPYMVKDIVTNEVFPLLFFHFSGFKPFDKSVLDRRVPKYNISDYPVLKHIVEFYAELELKNGYEIYSKIPYGFNLFDNGVSILPINRRLYHKWSSNHKFENLFSEKGALYKIFKKNSLLAKKKTKDTAIVINENEQKSRMKYNLLLKLFKLCFKILRLDKYCNFLIVLNQISQLNYQYEVFEVKE